MQQAQAAQPAPVRAQPTPVPVRYSPAPAPAYAPQQQPQQPQPRAPLPQQQMAPDPRAQAIDAMKAKTGGDYPNPEWQPQPAFLKTTEPYAPAPVGNVVPATSAPAPVRYSPPAPSAAPMSATPVPSTVPQGLPPALLPDDLLPYEPERAGADVFIPKSPVAMNPRFDPNAPHGGTPDPTIGPDGQTIPPRPILRPSPVRAEETTGADPSGQLDWESLADALGIGGLQDQVKETTAKEALGAMTSDLSEFGFNPEELQAQEDQIIRQAAEAKAKAMQQMAGRGLGGSGLEIAGLGNIDVGAISAITDLKTENKALQIEQRLNEIKTYLSAYGSQLDDETRNNLAAEAMELQKDQMEYEKGQQAEADSHTVLNNAIAQIGADKWDPEALAWAYDQLDEGADIQDILRELGVTSSGGAGGSQVYQTTEGTPGGGGVSGVTSGDAGVEDGFARPTGAVSFWTPESQMPIESLKAAYEQYRGDAGGSGAPAMNYADWVYWNILQSGTDPSWWSKSLDYALER